MGDSRFDDLCPLCNHELDEGAFGKVSCPDCGYSVDPLAWFGEEDLVGIERIQRRSVGGHYEEPE